MQNFGNNSFQGGQQPSFLSKITPVFNFRNIMIIALIIVLIVIAYYIYKSQTAKPSASAYRANTTAGYDPAQNSSGKEAELMLFYVDWCPHCKTAKPEWEQVKTEYEGKTVNGYNIIFTEVNCTNETPDVEKMVNTYKIEGYPTIKLLKDGQIVEFDAKPTKSNLEQFLKTVM